MRWITRAIQSQDGFTLAEALTAAAVVAIALVGMAIAVPTANYGVGQGHLMSTAAFLAEQRLEEVRSAEWTSVDPVKDEARVGNPSPDFPSENYGTIAGYGTFRRAVTITAAPGNPNLRQVTVSVFYFPLTGGGGAAPTEQNVTLTTLIALRQ